MQKFGSKEKRKLFLRQRRLFVQDAVSRAGFLKRQKERCRSFGERFITSLAYVVHTLCKHLWVTCFLEMLCANGCGTFLLIVTAALCLQKACPCLVFLLQVCGASWAATQGHPRFRCLKTVWNGMKLGSSTPSITSYIYIHIHNMYT